MDTDKIIIILTQLLSSTGIIYFFFSVIKGLKSQITSLKGVVNTQTKQIETFNKELDFIKNSSSMLKSIMEDTKTLMDLKKEIVETHDFKIGDKVRISQIQQSDIITDNGPIIWHKSMNQYCNKITEIVEINLDGEPSVLLGIDNGQHHWSKNWLTKI